MIRVVMMLSLWLVAMQPGQAGDAWPLTPTPLDMTDARTAPDSMSAVPLSAQTVTSAWWQVLPAQPEGEAHRLWSAWGDAVWAGDRVYMSIGDHGTPYGTCFVYQVDPSGESGADTIQVIADINAALSLTDPAKYAPGKIHAPLIAGKDGYLYFGTYRGSIRQTGPETGYAGDWLFRYPTSDQPAGSAPQGQAINSLAESLGIWVPYSSAVALQYHPASHTIYGLAVFGQTMPEPQQHTFFVYSIEQGKIVFSAESPSRMNRSLMLSADGVAYVAGPDGKLQKWAPGDTALTATDMLVPGDGKLRAAAPSPRPDGTLAGISNDGHAFLVDPATDTLRAFDTPILPPDAGRAYTAACRLSPDGRYLYYIPSAHGKSRLHGTALLRYDLQLGRPEAIAYLHAPLLSQHAYNAGGTYSLALSPDGHTLAVLLNGGPAGQKRNDFGICSALVLTLSPATD